MKQIKGTDKIGYADVIHIVFSDKCVKKYLHGKNSLDYTFNEIMKDACKKGYTDGTILVIAESPLDGKVYRYGNYGKWWDEVGCTQGYA